MEENRINEVPPSKTGKHVIIDYYRGSMGLLVTEADDGILYVSARSIGDINVQVIMERFNGGGHANVAGAQLKDKKKEDFFVELKQVLKEMTEAGDI